MVCLTDLLWSRARIRRLRARNADPGGPHPTHALRTVRPYAPGAVQRDGGHAAQGQKRQVAVLRRHADPDDAVDRGDHGVLGVAGLGIGEHTVRCGRRGHAAGVPSGGWDVCSQRVFDGEQDVTYTQAIRASR